jgi:hypothetical protein
MLDVYSNYSRYSVRISGVTLAILTEVLRVSCQSLQAIAGIVPRLDHDFILPNSFQFISKPVI